MLTFVKKLEENYIALCVNGGMTVDEVSKQFLDVFTEQANKMIGFPDDVR